MEVFVGWAGKATFQSLLLLRENESCGVDWCIQVGTSKLEEEAASRPLRAPS